MSCVVCVGRNLYCSFIAFLINRVHKLTNFFVAKKNSLTRHTQISGLSNNHKSMDIDSFKVPPIAKRIYYISCTWLSSWLCIQTGNTRVVASFQCYFWCTHGPFLPPTSTTDRYKFQRTSDCIEDLYLWLY